MSENNQARVCPICERSFRPKESEYNIKEHIESHERENLPPPKRMKVVPRPKGTRSLLSYFKPTTTKDVEDDRIDNL